MVTLTQPTPAQIQTFIEAQETSSFSYEPVGMLSGEPPTGFVVDHIRGQLGTGEVIFQEAKDAIQSWQHFQLGWVEPCDASKPIEEGQIVGILARCFGVWFLNACRIVTVIETTEPIVRFGYSYGTLADHAESGEERFQVEWNLSDNSVWYDILAYSRPQKWYTKLGTPVVRRIQKRFAQDSLAAMQRSVDLTQLVRHQPKV